MVLIPPDAGVRLRMQTEAGLLQPVQPAREVADLPDLQPGQGFTARIQESLPDNLYKALVAGRNLTLQLPQGAKSGDILELVVVDRTASGAVVAQRTGTEAANLATAGEPYPYATLSKAAQMIGQLLLPEGDSPQSAALNRGQPLLSQPPTSAAELVPTLAKAVSDSGLFYESHQAQWIAGGRSAESLREEPQAQQQASRAAYIVSEKPSTAPSLLQSLFGDEGKANTANPQQQAATLASSVPENLRPVVQQQLDALATQHLAWRGEVWPGQTMDWEIERERVEDNDVSGDTESQRWSTRLRLTMPRLGTVDALMQLTPDGDLRLKLASDDQASIGDLRAAGPQLAESLAAAGLRLTGLDVRQDNG